MKLFRLPHSRRRGLALIIVLALVGLMTMLMLAMFSVSESELKAAHTHSHGQEARQLSEVAVNLAMSQIRKATSQNIGTQGWEAWASQPGLVRRFSTAGVTQEAYKLYSSKHLVLRDAGQIEQKLLEDVPPTGWDLQPNRYVDLNKPAVRAAADGTPLLLFPVIDPRAQSSSPSSSVGGFSYKDTNLAGSKLSGVRVSGGDQQRVPMPVEWLYVLKDGSLGSLSEAGVFQGASQPTSANPIVGRVAFWSDDESSKVNINTASEPTAWAVPTFFYDQDARYARYQPLNGEFQRYPGHPAMTALSPVLFPGQNVTVAQKESIYQVIPKVSSGGSLAGTRAFSDPEAEAVQLTQARRERLFASVDELLLGENRQPNKLGGVEISAAAVQRSSFFLTAQGRAPESNPFGLPKIAVWPVSYRGAEYRTPFDQMVMHCSTLRNASASGRRAYAFQRGWADSPTQDVTYPANSELLSYLKDLLSKPNPGFASSAADTFTKKYGDDAPQILVEIFDYIRGINLHDGTLVKPTDKFNGEGKAQNFMLGYAPGSARPTNFKTFTDPRFFAPDPENPNADEAGQTERQGFPGHGQTTPSRWTTGGVTVQGIGRFPTITEVGLHFICAADNTDDPNNPQEEKYAFLGKPGGGSAPKAVDDGSGNDRWYSNFPPRPLPIPGKNPANNTKYPLTGGYPYGTNPQHPGYQKPNWNHQLEANTPLQPGYRRVQARLLLEFFVPAAGYTILEPELTVRVTGLSRFLLNGQRLFPNDEEIIWSSRRAIHNGNQRSGGYGIGVTGMQTQRFAPARAPMPADNNWGADAWEVKPTNLSSGDRLCVINYDLISNFVDVNVARDGSQLMALSSGAGTLTDTPLSLELWSGHYGRNASTGETPPAVVQNLNLNFPAAELKAPTLIRNTLPANGVNKSTPDVEPVAYWTFYSKGAFGFDVENLAQNTGVRVVDQRGRLWNSQGAPYAGAQRPTVPLKGAFFYGYDYPLTGAKRVFRPRQVRGDTMSELLLAEETEGSDVVQTVQIAHGDYRLSAALPVVPETMWKKHRFFGQRRLAHNFTKSVSDHLPGYDYGSSDDLEDNLVPTTASATYPVDRVPDFPYNEEAALAAHRYGDFDNGVGPARDGPYINKPDEGNLNVVVDNNGLGYFTEGGLHRSTEKDFYSPNRLIPSPVVLGSLPSRVLAGDAWRTLLFRPQQGHPGGPPKFGGSNPPDHLLLEFFWMPVVEPYAISEPFSTAGKVNLNYQIFPFTHIRRATGMHAVLAGEVIHAVPTVDAPAYKSFPDNSNKNAFWGETQAKTWHFKVDSEKTLAQFEERFAQGKAFVSPSEICDVHLVPQGVSSVSSYRDMDTFWSEHRLTGDNTRERPYAGIYPRVTTRSNTFRVHFIAQTLKKDRSSRVDEIGPDDRVTGEYRGSSLIERHLDPTQPDLPDFATNANGQTLDHFHRLRVLETRRFGF
ncbi:MAG: Verru_Chthon cassette protein A [Verrucomicrobiota bacterium]